MIIINDIWLLIKEYLFHNIKKQGKHLKDDVEIKKYNKVLKKLPKLTIPRYGPRIIYSDIRENNRLVKFIYYLPYNDWEKMIIFFVPFEYYYSLDKKINNDLVLEEYYNINETN